MSVTRLDGGAMLAIDELGLAQFATAATRQPVRGIAADVAATAARNAPRVTGRLAASIQVVERAGEIAVEATAPYAAYVEFGTRHRRATPFLRPAAAVYRR